MVTFPEAWAKEEERRILAIWAPIQRFKVNGHVVKWKSRLHRKGKQAGHVLKGHRLVGVAYWDISWWVAFTFTVASLLWVFNGAVLYLEAFPESVLQSVAAWTAFAGGTGFFFGGWFMYLEALNIEDHAEFGDEMRMKERHFLQCFAAILLCRHPGLYDHLRWKWVGWRSFHEIGFLAGVSQFIGTTIFYIAVITGLPGMLPSSEESHVGLYQGVYWTPQVVGAFFLLLSSVLIMLETQESWWRIKIADIGWHVGFWNVLGSVGFLLSGAFGFVETHHSDKWTKDTVYASTFFGSISYLLGSYLQLYEFLN
eukprot:jgi/Mesvir1/16535/Mv10079-RA.1